MDKFDADEVLATIAREKVTAVFLAPAMMLSRMVSMLMPGRSGLNADLEQQTPDTLRNVRVMPFTCVLVMTPAALIFAILSPLCRKEVEAAQAELAQRREEAVTA